MSGMRLYNVIAVWDGYVVAESEEAARNAMLANIHDTEQPLPVSDVNAIEAREARHVREAWADERPLVGDDVSDADFAKLKGKTTTEARSMIYAKLDADKAAEKTAAKKEKTK